MAEAIVNYVLGKISDAAYQEALLLFGARHEVEWAKHELRWVRALLKDADEKHNKDARVKQWVEDVKEVAFMIEDALDKFLVEVGGGSVKGFLEKAHKIPKVLHARHKVGTKMDNIRKMMIEIKENRESFGIMTMENSSVVPAARQPIGIIPEIDKTEIVGFEEDINNIRKLLLDQDYLGRTVTSIVAPGGCGKTTIAAKIYNSAEVQCHFGILVWLTISQKWTMIDVLIKILEKLKVEVTAEMRQKGEEYLIVELHRCLSDKRYLIVFDDVWSIHFWTQIKVALPEDNNGSRVLITTRNSAVAEKADTRSEPYKLRFLDEDESQKLLLKKVFPNRNCPNNLLPLANQFAQKCKGLPMALVVLGGFLSYKAPNYNTWSEIMSKMNWNTEGSDCMDIVSTSFDDLPVHLKPCFMYFASFPEDYEIRASRLIRMWIAEGFIQPEIPKSLEDTAMNYLEELIQRCMVQVSKTSTLNKIKNCRIHDILHALAIRKAEEDNFLVVFTNSLADSNSGIHTSTPIRRVAFHEFADAQLDPVQLIGPNLRSLMCFGTSLPDCNKLEMVRVLSLRYEYKKNSSSGNDEDSKWKWIKQVTCLRYLQVKNSGRLERPNLSHLAQLKYLQTLEISGLKHRKRNATIRTKCLSCMKKEKEKNKNKNKNKNNYNDNFNPEHDENEKLIEGIPLIELPDSFWDNKMLRHAIFPQTERWLGPPSSAKLDNLLTLKGVHVRAEWSSVKLPHFPRIRKLSITIFEVKIFNWEVMSNSLAQLEHLTSLHVFATDFKLTKSITVTPAFINYKQLRSLSLPTDMFSDSPMNISELIISSSDMLPPNLVKLRYGWFEDPIVLRELRKKLPHLQVLAQSHPNISQWSRVG